MFVAVACALSIAGADAQAAPATATTTAALPVLIEVYVPLCDGAHLACGNGGLGEPRNLDENLYWGAMYGAERFLAKTHGYAVVSRRDNPDAAKPSVLREVVIERAPASKSERAVRLRMFAYAGDRIDDAVADFAHALSTSQADVIVWSGHDRLMDVDAPAVETRTDGKQARVAVLACESEKYFGPVLKKAGAFPLALTRTFMAPEAYLLEALATSHAKGVDVRESLTSAYAKYQKISHRAASTVFSRE